MPSETPQLQPIVPGYKLRILSDEQLTQFKSATMEILDKVGVHCPSKEALGIYAEHGAQVDNETLIVKLPPDVVVGAMPHAPRYYTMGARSQAYDLNLDGSAMYLATDGSGTETVDFETGQRRSSTKGDVAKAVGPRGHFLSQKHTRRHIRRFDFSELTGQPAPGGGDRDPIEVARDKTDWILENHHPEPLSDEQQAEFGHILRAADKEIGSG